MDDCQKSGTRIFKKSAPNGKLTIYLRKRDFIDHLTHVDPVEGVVLVDRDYIKDRKVFINLLGAFRYGRDEVDLLGLNYHKDIYLSTKQVYPPPVIAPTSDQRSGIGYHANNAQSLEPPCLTRLQERLIRKLGANAYPFYFQLPAYSAPSVSLLLNPSDTTKPCRIDYELRVYVADDQDQKPQKRNSVRMVIRKLTYAPPEIGPQPSMEVVRDFLMSVGSLRVEASLDKQKYYHGESLSVNVLVDNNSNKAVKRIRLSVRQYTQICLHSAINYKCTLVEIQSEEGFPIFPSQTGWCKVYRLRPLLADNRDKVGVAIDGELKNENTNLASSTIDPPPSFPRNSIGITVQYKVKVRLVLGFGLSDVCLQLPFILTHPNSSVMEDEDVELTESAKASSLVPAKPINSVAVRNGVTPSNPTQPSIQDSVASSQRLTNSSPPLTANSTLFCSLNPTNHLPPRPVLQLPSNGGSARVDRSATNEDDWMFENFARLRLRHECASHQSSQA